MAGHSPADAGSADLAHDIVVIGASAGGLPALQTLVAGLPSDFTLPLVAMLHLPPQSNAESVLRRLPLAVERLRHGETPCGRTLWICPPRTFVDILPDGSCVIADNPTGALARPIDRLLSSAARSFGPRAIGVILSGMGDDGALGVRELHLAGGRVLVQALGDAEYTDMPAAAIGSGAADLVVPLSDMGEVITEFARGMPRSDSPSELRAVQAAFGSEGLVAATARMVDWQATPLGSVLVWPDRLKQLVRETMDDANASALWWGRPGREVEIYNDAWHSLLGSQQSQALGQAVSQNWNQRWGRMGALTETVMKTGRAIAGEPLSLAIQRDGQLEDLEVDFSCAPLRAPNGQLLGLRCTMLDTTQDVLARRRMQLLQRVGSQMARTSVVHEACSLAAQAIVNEPAEVPFALFYLLDKPRQQATLVASAGLPSGCAAAPRIERLTGADHVPATWPLERVLPQFDSPAAPPLLVEHLEQRFADLAVHLGAPSNANLRALLVPLPPTSRTEPLRVLVMGLAPRRRCDAASMAFAEQLGQQVASGLGEARAKELERERGDRLAALDRAKTEFFSNVSHEFRTPLTLLLAPLEEMARERETLSGRIAGELDVAVRNARRLLRLVNSLLDFSQIDTRGRLAQVMPTDLGLLTEDIASAFRSAIEAAGLTLHVDIAPDLPLVPAHPTMWEQVVSNLLSNALKFTFEGGISVHLKTIRLHAELEVRDTGTGIPPEELPNVFKRFHRVRGARARTAEGSGIGLAMVHDLVQRMGGQLTVRSTPGTGSSFTIWLPLKTHRSLVELPDDAAPAAPPQLAADLADEALRWSVSAAPQGVLEDLLEPPAPAAAAPIRQRPRLLVADDNADLRNYLHRLLASQWEVQLAADGEQAMELMLAQPPDVLLLDVMMPRLDGFALLQRLRETPTLATVPVIMLTARASEEAAIEGLRAGANDYIAKPFSPRELVARLQATLGRARAESALRESEAKFRAVFENMIEACCIFDMIYDDLGRPVDWKILEANPGYEEQSGLKDVAGKLASEVMPGTESYWTETFGQVVETGEARQIEKWHEPTGRWVHSSTARVGGAGSRRLVSVFYDITERKRAEIALQHSEKRHAFLLELSDALRAAPDEASIAAAALQLTATHLAVARCWIAVLIPEEDRVLVAQDHCRPDLSSMAGEYRHSNFPAPASAHRTETETSALDDISSDASLSDEDRARFADLKVGARLAVFLRKGNGRVIWSLMVADEAPRRWTQQETALLEEAAERTWAALERARADAALRETAERLSVAGRGEPSS